MLLVTGCGRGPGPTYAEVRPCLERAGIVGALGVERKTVYKVTIAFRGARSGSGTIFFHKSEDANKNAAARARINGFRPTILSRTAIAYWFGDPSAKDRRRVSACF